MSFRDTWLNVRELWTGELHEKAMRWGRRVLIVGVVVFLIVQLRDVDWIAVWRELPTHPLFYLLFLGMYFGLPVAETFIYRLLWGIGFRQSFPVLLQKRVYNRDVLNYSGEAHLFLWAKKNVNHPARRILRDMKDNAIISSLTSLALAVTLLGIFLFAGLVPFEVLFPGVQLKWILAGGFCLVLVIMLGVRFRKAVIALPASTALSLFGLHFGRVLFVQTLQVFQWAIVMPEVPWSAWFTFLALQIVVNQLPLLPAKDLIVLGASTEVSRWLEISETSIVGMLLVVVVMDKVLNLVLFSYLSSRGSDGSAGSSGSVESTGSVVTPTTPYTPVTPATSDTPRTPHTPDT